MMTAITYILFNAPLETKCSFIVMNIDFYVHSILYNNLGTESLLCNVK